MTYVHSFELAGLPRMPNEFSQGPNGFKQRWREGQQWAKDVWAMCAGANRPGKPLQRAKVTFVRVSWSSKLGPDSDGLAHSFKPVRDGLVKAQVLVDDSPEHLEAHYFWEKGVKGKGYIRVTIQEIP